ncbi:transketolase C-terminal domain-containing protein, partial [Bacillus cereus]|uniref:transketolase C-terminal domain-containing protein n=1 Tax=Bacillus cereus TaxID=1396 RepID=UPI00283FCCAF
EHKRAYSLIKGEVAEDHYVLPLGKAEVKREADDITVITYGLCVHFAIQAAEKLAQDGISAHILDLRTVYPLAKEAIIEAAAKTSKVLLVT